MSRFHLVRHAEKNCASDLLAGRLPNIRLTSRGQAQAEQLAVLLSAERVMRIVSSPRERAQDTAAPLARRCGMSVEIAPELDEYDCGDWTGKTFGELERSTPLWATFNAQRSLVRIPGGESALEVQLRVVNWILAQHVRDPEGVVVAVSHGDPLRFAVAYFLGMPLDHFLRFEIDVGSVTTLALEAGGPRLLRINHRPEAARP